MCRCVRQLLPERLRRVKVAQACRAFLAAAQRGREHAAGIGERRGRKLCLPRRQLQRPAVREAPLRRPDKAVPCIAGPQAGEDRQRFRRKGVPVLPGVFETEERMSISPGSRALPLSQSGGEPPDRSRSATCTIPFCFFVTGLTFRYSALLQRSRSFSISSGHS